MSGSLFAHLSDAAPPAETAVLHQPSGPSWTYGALYGRSARYAGALASFGVKPDDRVLVQAEKSAELVCLYLGCLRAGAVFVPLNTAYTPREVGYFLDDAAPRLLVCDPGARDAFPADSACETLGADGAGSLALLADRAEMADPVPREADDLAAILYTSGTTGRSKGAMLSHGNLAANARALIAAWGMTGEDVLLHALPIFHTHGLFVAINTVLLAGGSMIFLPKFDAEAVLAALPDATLMMGVPTFYTRLLARSDLTQARTAHMRAFISGSAPLSPEAHKAFEARTGHVLIERYGMTETNIITSTELNGPRRAGTVGVPLDGVELRICDPETGALRPQGEVGVVEVRGTSVFQGYWRNPEKTRTEFRNDGFFITGDLGLIEPDGVLRLVGRAKDLIITGGLNVYPAEVEAAIDALPGVAEAAVIGVPHADFGEAVTALVVTEPGAQVTEEAVRQALKGTVAPFKIPKRVIVVEALPRNAMGKVQKAALRETYTDLFGSTDG